MPKKQTSTESTVANPVAPPFSMYAACRQATMMDAQLWLLIMKEQDIPAPPLSPIAPSQVNHSIEAQQ